MMNFTVTCLLAATSVAVHLQTADADPLLEPLKNLTDIKIQDGQIKVVEEDTIELDILKPLTVPDEVAQIETVLEQISAGFEEIESINFEVEVDEVADKQDQLKDEVDEILEEADAEISEVVEEESDEDDAKDDIDDIIDDAGDMIEELNLEHDIDMMSAAQTSLITTLTNQAAEDAVKDDIIAGLEDGEDLESVVKQQELPFEVEVIPIKKEVKAKKPKETLRRMVCRNGECKESIKEDPEFDSFLGGLIQGRGKAHLQSAWGTKSPLDMPDSFDFDAFF